LLDQPKSADAPDNLFRAPTEIRERSHWTVTGGKGGVPASLSPDLIKRHPVAACAAAFVAAALAGRFLFGPGVET
jgi:hypothetical protein